MAASSGGNPALPLAVAAACGLVVLAYSAYKARRGDWGHIDASHPGERAQLNTRVGIGFLAIAGVMAAAGVHVRIAVVVALSGCIVLAGHLLQRTGKLSLHVAFAVFAAFIAWPQQAYAAALLLIAVAVGWSRLVLQRHTRRDLVLGGLVGSMAGLVFQAVRVFDA